MWQEARKHEKRVKHIIVDYKKRAERRHDFYQRVRADPNQFLRINGLKCKILIDDQDGVSALIPWQAQSDNLIDRFDVRTHLETVPKYVKDEKSESEVTVEERQLNYERYRVLVQNEFLGISEEKFLHQLQLEEQFGTNHVSEPKTKKPKDQGVSIGFQYEDSTSTATQQFKSFMDPKNQKSQIQASAQIDASNEDVERDSSDEELDIDLTLDTNKITNEQAHELNTYGNRYGMQGNDFYSFLTKDLFEAEAAKLAQEDDQEKLLFGGRKSRRERRAHRERKMNFRLYDNENKPSYAKVEEVEKDGAKHESDSGSSSGPETEKITYITSFGNEEESSKNKNNKNSRKSPPMLYSEKLKQALANTSKSSDRSKDSRSRRRRSPYKSRRHESPPSSSRSILSGDKNHDSHKTEAPPAPPLPPAEPPSATVPIRSYYRRSLSNSSASSDENKNGETESKSSTQSVPTSSEVAIASLRARSSSGGVNRANVASALLKKKMQMLLNKQYKEDKKLELIKKKQQLQEKEERDMEMREIALKLRKRQRELRHRYSTPDSDSNEEKSESEKEEQPSLKPPGVSSPAPSLIKSYKKPPSRTRSSSSSSSSSSKSSRSSGSIRNRKTSKRRSRSKSRSRLRSKEKSVSRSDPSRRRRSRDQSRDRYSYERRNSRERYDRDRRPYYSNNDRYRYQSRRYSRSRSRSVSPRPRYRSRSRNRR